MAELLRRLRMEWRHTFMLALAGGTVGLLTTVPQWLMRIEQTGMADFYRHFPRGVLSTMVGALFVAFALRACTRSASELLERPLKFLAMLTCGTLAATVIAKGLNILLRGRPLPLLEQLNPPAMLDFWLETMLWGGLMGWLYLLLLQRREDALRLSGLLGKRALLARQLAHSKLGTARAQIDPAMVARVLAGVEARYASDASGASALLDHLINYLRLAMSRARDGAHSMVAELALVRAYCALRESELGIRIAVSASADGEPRALFARACAALESAIAQGARDIKLNLEE